MTFEGKAIIAFPSSAEGQVQVSFLEAFDPKRVLEGIDRTEAVKRIGALYSLCRTGQTQAALAALEQAMAVTPTDHAARTRESLILSERLQENLMRLAIDWAGWPNEKSSPLPFATVRSLLATLNNILQGNLAASTSHREDSIKIEDTLDQIQKFIEDEILEDTTARWVSLRGKDIERWSQEGEKMPARTIAYITGNRWQTLGAIYGAGPAGDTSTETSLYTRWHGEGLVRSWEASEKGGLLSRLLCRLVEIAKLPDLIRTTVRGDRAIESRVWQENGSGCASVQVARGRLMHTVKLDGDKVSAYRISSPSHVNFAPHGMAQRIFQKMFEKNRDQLAAAAHVMVRAVDPCVSCELEGI